MLPRLPIKQPAEGLPTVIEMMVARLRLAAEETLQEGMLGGGEGIGYGDGVPDEAGLEVFREEEAAAGFGSGGEDHAVPEAEAMTYSKFGSAEEHWQGSFRNGEGVAPTEESGAGLRGGSFGLTDNNLEEFADSLGREYHDVTGERVEQIEGRLLHCPTIQALGVDQDVGVERYPHSASS
jgi:hypothetical protein